MNKRKLKLIYGTLKYASLSQLKNESTFALGVMVGLYQGLKYNGSMIRGIKSGVATMAVISLANGVMNVIENWDKLQNI